MVARRVRASLARSGGSPTAWCGLALALGLAATGCDDRLAARLAEPPGRTPAGASRCQVTASQLRPLIVEWEAADRASLEVRLRREGLVAVRYAGCELEVLRCQAAGKYQPDGNNRRKGLAVIELRGDEAYYYLQETDQRYWDSVAGTFRASAATLRVDPPAGG